MRREGYPISLRVLHHHDHSHRPLMAFGKIRPLAGVAPVLCLEVKDQPIDFHVDDFRRPEEADVASFAVITGWQLEGCFPRWIRDRAEELGDGQLSRVTECVPATGVGANDHIQANGLAHCAERRDADAGIAFLDSSLSVG